MLVIAHCNIRNGHEWFFFSLLNARKVLKLLQAHTFHILLTNISMHEIHYIHHAVERQTAKYRFEGRSLKILEHQT